MAGRTISSPASHALLGLILALACVSVSAASSGPSFDCAKAANDAEKAICASAPIAALDLRLAAAYHVRLGREPTLVARQRAWLMARDAACGSNGECLSAFIAARLKWMAGSAPMPTNKPKAVGQCALTTVSRKTYRFEGEPDSGSAAVYANGGFQVSYDTVPEIEASKVGDPVLFCLADIPQDCPKDDDRGKVNAVANLRTLKAWALSETEHSCGGA